MSPARRVEALGSSHPALISRNRVEPSCLGLWSVFTSCIRRRQASEELSPGKEPHSFGWRGPLDLAMADSLTSISRSRIFEMVLWRTMMRKEAGESSEALPGLSRTTLLAVLREGGWYPQASNGERSSSKIAGLMRLSFFHTE